MKELNKLPETIERNGQKFRLFITKYDEYWELSYAKGEYYCDRDHLEKEDEYMLLHAVQDRKLSDCVKHMFEFLEKMKNYCKICNHPSTKLNEDGICPDCL